MSVFRCFLFCLFFVGCLRADPDTSRPNLVLIVTDDQGYWDVGFNGCTDIPTPHIDRIAEEGVRFANGYVTYPVCGPSRAMSSMGLSRAAIVTSRKTSSTRTSNRSIRRAVGIRPNCAATTLRWKRTNT